MLCRSRQQGSDKERLVQIVLSIADGLVRQELKSALESRGHVIRSASNGIEAMLHIQRQLPDVLVVDLEMPLMGGARTAEEIRNDPRAKGLPIIGIVSHGNSVPHLLPAFDVVMEMPFGAGELLAAISKAVN